LGLKGDDYLLAVARFVPEKGLLDLIQAYEIAGLDYKLVIAGDSDHEDDYSIKIKELAGKNPDILLTGYVTGNKLAELFSHARCFVLPSYHEGLPIVLLEALSYGLPVIASDIAANLEVEIKGIEYFSCGDITDLSKALIRISDKQVSEAQAVSILQALEVSYNWQRIADQTCSVYEQVMSRQRRIQPVKE
jgi:glycosyltransferase involved in cell wall biosynthesis